MATKKPNSHVEVERRARGARKSCCCTWNQPSESTIYKSIELERNTHNKLA